MKIKSKEMTKNRSFYQKKTERRYTTKLTEETNEKKDIKKCFNKIPPNVHGTLLRQIYTLQFVTRKDGIEAI